jgi:nitrilase
MPETVAATVRVAVVQAAPVMFDREATVAKACRLVAACGDQGAQLVLLPEAYVPGYPRGLDFGVTVGGRTAAGRDLFRQYWDSSVDVPGPTVTALGDAAAQARTHLAIGVVERAAGTLYCTVLYFGADGALLGTHRKLKPTAAERFVWGEGDGSTLTVVQAEFGRYGGLICWENYMPLARAALYAKGVDVYLAPTADARDSWQATVRHIACEGRCFLLSSNQFVTCDDYPESLRHQLEPGPRVRCRGGSAIVSPYGEALAGPLYDEEGILLADLDLAEVVRGRFDLDVVGHYARPDIFRLTVDERPRPTVETTTA